MAHSHSHDAGVDHSHDDPFNGHGHSHDILDGPGSYVNREMPLIEGRDWKDRAFTIGIGGYVPRTVEEPLSCCHRFAGPIRISIVEQSSTKKHTCMQTRRIRKDSTDASTVSGSP